MGREERPESSWANATWALLYYVVIPSVLLNVIMWRFPELSREQFTQMLRWVLILGTILVGVNALRAEHAVGTRARLVLDSTYVVLTIGWLLGLLGGGTILRQSWNGYDFIIDITGLFIIIAALASLNLVYYALCFAKERGLLSGGGGEPSPDAEPHPGSAPEPSPGSAPGTAPGPDPKPGAVTIEYAEDGAAS